MDRLGGISLTHRSSIGCVRTLGVVLAVFASGCQAARSTAPPPPPPTTATIVGTVTSSLLGTLGGVTVTVTPSSGAPLSTVTSASGTYRIGGVPPLAGVIQVAGVPA